MKLLKSKPVIRHEVKLETDANNRRRDLGLIHPYASMIMFINIIYNAVIGDFRGVNYWHSKTFRHFISHKRYQSLNARGGVSNA